MLEISRRVDDTPGPGAYVDPMKEGRNSVRKKKMPKKKRISLSSSSSFSFEFIV
jgi:hypothetical protein